MTAVAGDPVRVGVLGCAQFAWRRMLPALATEPLVRVTVIASRDPDRARHWAARFGCRPVPGYDELLAAPDVDAVYVPLPPALHERWIRAALAAGKHVLAEKPLTTDPAGTRELVALARHRRLLLRENVLFEHHSQHAAVRSLVAAGTLGEPRQVDAAFCVPPLPPGDIRYVADLGGGSLRDLGGYPFRAAQHLLDAPVRVAGAWLRMDPVAGVDLAGAAVGECAGLGVTARFGFEHSYGSWYCVWGSEARLVLERPFTPPADRAPVLRLVTGDREERRTLPPDDQVANAVRAFARDVLAGCVDDGVASVRTAEAIEAVHRRAVPPTGRPGQRCHPALS